MFFWFSLLAVTFVFYGLCKFNNGRGMRIAAILYCIVLVFLAGMRSGIGDTGYYLVWFNNYKNASFWTLIVKRQGEYGFNILLALIGMISKDPQVFLMIIAFVTIGGVFYTIIHYSEDVALSLFLFLTGGFFVGMMNGIRQYLVVVCLFLLIKYVLNNKPLPFIFTVILLSTVHKSVLFMAPVFFFLQLPVWKLNTLLLIGAMFALFFAFAPFLHVMEDVLEGSRYWAYVDSMENGMSRGANILRVVVAVIPAIISFIGRKKFTQDDRFYNVCSNALLFSALCYLFAIKDWVFARLAMYFNIYMLLFYPYVLPVVFRRKEISCVKFVLIMLYAMFFLYDVRNTPYMSYYLNINKGLIGVLTRSVYE